jgi:hypothetical protein
MSLVTTLPASPGGLLVVAGGVVAGQAIDVFLGLEIEAGILPAVADVATVAGGFVRGDRNAEVIDDGLFAQRLLGLGIQVFPFPVLGAVDLAGGLGVAFKAGLGDFRAGTEGFLQLLELCVVGGGGEFERFGSGPASPASTGPVAASQPAQQSASAARLNR